MSSENENDVPNIYVIDDEEGIRVLLKKRFLRAGFNVTTFKSAREFLKIKELKQPGCIILDVNMPQLSGLKLQKELNRINVSLPVIFITGCGDVQTSVEAMKCGAVDFLEKPFSKNKLLSVVKHALELNISQLEENNLRNEILSCYKTLTPREKEVLPHIASGLLNKQVAFELGTTEKTIKVHRGRIMKKFNAASIADLVRFFQIIEQPVNINS